MSQEEKKIQTIYMNFYQELKSYIFIIKKSYIDDKYDVFFQMYKFLDEKFDIWYNMDSRVSNMDRMKNVIKEKLEMLVYNYQPKQYLDYYLNLQCKFGFENYCIATTKKNIRCRHNKNTGMYCNLHYNINIKRKKYLNKFINKDVSNIIITYL